MSFYKTNAILQIKNYTISLCVKEQKKPENVKDIGIDNIQGYYVGNVVNVSNSLDKIFPSDIQIMDRGILNIDNDLIIGEFIISQLIRSRFKQLENKLGQQFQGYLFNKKSYNSNDWV